MVPFDWQALLALGLLLVVALSAGGVAEHLRLPKGTAYLLVGAVLGATVLDRIDPEHVKPFEPLTRLAISLVLFNLGCHFPLARVRRIMRRIVRLSMGEMSATFVLVCGGLLLLYAGWGGMALLQARWPAAVLLGAVALATAPATTILVLKETESEGPITEYTSGLVAMNNLVAIVLFELLFLVIELQQNVSSFPGTELARFAGDLAGSVLLGMAGGLIVSYAFGLVADSRRLVLLFGVIVLLLGICGFNQMPYLLTFLAMGFTVANTSDKTRQVLAEMDRMTGLLCVVFFVTHGTDLRLGTLVEAGVFGVGYIALRSCGKYFGIRLAAVRGREEPVVRKWLGATMIAHAGAAITLATVALERAPEGTPLHALCEHVQTVILGTVVAFELAGPILIRHAVLQAGEVPLAHAIHHSTSGLVSQFRTIWNRLLIALGRNPWRNRSAADLTVDELMRKKVSGVRQTATFDEVITLIEHSRDNTYPVLGLNGELVGVIRYRELSSALFDPALGPLVRAADVTTRADYILHPDEPVTRAHEMFETTKDDCIPVVTRGQPSRFLGFIRRRDVLRMLIRGQKDSPA